MTAERLLEAENGPSCDTILLARSEVDSVISSIKDDDLHREVQNAWENFPEDLLEHAETGTLVLRTASATVSKMLGFAPDEARRLTGAPFRDSGPIISTIIGKMGSRNHHYIDLGRLLGVIAYTATYKRLAGSFPKDKLIPWRSSLLSETTNALGIECVLSSYFGGFDVEGEATGDFRKRALELQKANFSSHIPYLTPQEISHLADWSFSECLKKLQLLQRCMAGDLLAEEDIPSYVQTAVAFALAVVDANPTVLMNFKPTLDHGFSAHEFKLQFSQFLAVWKLRNQDLAAANEPLISHLGEFLERVKKKAWKDFDRGKHEWAKKHNPYAEELWK